MHLSGGALYVMALYVIVVSSGGGKYATVVLIVISDKVPIEINCARAFAKSNTCIFIKCVMLLRESPVLFYLNYNLFACCLCALPFDCTVSW